MISKGTLSLMSDSHLVSAMYGERELTDYEEELLKRLEKYIDKESSEEVESRLEKTYESVVEQSEFRRQVIEDIIAMCSSHNFRYKETKELTGSIIDSVSESYVEL